jgi:hypothetical protein
MLLYVQLIVPPTMAASNNTARMPGMAKPSRANAPSSVVASTQPPPVSVSSGFGVELTPLDTPFNEHVGMDDHEPTRKLVVTANSPAGHPNNFELVRSDGEHVGFSNVAGLQGELRIATARDDGQGLSRGGFRPGELFTGAGTPGIVARVKPDGSAVQTSWVVLSDQHGVDAGLPGGLHVDRTGVFGGDLIVVTTQGGVWRVNSAGAPARLASLGTRLEV